MTTVELHNDKKRKATSLERDDDAEEKHSFKKMRRVGIEVASCDEQSLTYLMHHPTLTLERFQKVSSRYTATHLREEWAELLDHMDYDRPKHALFLERLHDFLERNDRCKAYKAIYILSKNPVLTFQDHYTKCLDLIELVLMFVDKPKHLLKAVAQVRDDEECRNQRFFQLLINHIRYHNVALAEKEEALVCGEWPVEGDAEGENGDVEMEDRAGAGDVPDEDDKDFTSGSESTTDDDHQQQYKCDPQQDLMEWLQDRTESSGSNEHRCPAGFWTM